MAWQFPISTAVSINLGTADSVLVAAQVIVAGGIQGTGVDQEVRVKGTVAGNFGIALGSGDGSAVTNYRIDIRGTGEVYGNQAAVSVYGVDNTVINNGIVESFAQWAFFIRGAGAAAATTITNTGEITGAISGISISSTNTQTIVLYNSGLLQGGTDAYGPNSVTPSNVDLLTNTGRIVGDVRLGALNDVYDGAKGRIDGGVYGGDGGDRMAGGSENNVLEGEAGKDKLTGGGGADELHGGSEADLFIYRTVTDSKNAAPDRILDFSVAGGDRIDLRPVDADSLASKNQRFEFVEGGQFSGDAGELIVRHKDGGTFVLGEGNGDRKVDFKLELVGSISLDADDFML